MSIYDDLKKGGLTTLALGVGIVGLLPAVLPVVARGVRPLFQSAVRGGIVCLEKGQEAVSEIRGILEDTAAESGRSPRNHDVFTSGMGAGAGPAMAAERAAEAAAGKRMSEPPAPAAPASPVAPASSATTVASRSEPLTRPTGEPDPEVLG